MFVVASLLCALPVVLASAGPDVTGPDVTGLNVTGPDLAGSSTTHPEARQDTKEPARDRGIILELLAGKKLYNCVCGHPNRNSRIIGGESADIHEFPWLADVIALGVLAGAGSLINDRYVITAATNVKGMTPYDVKVTLGAHNRCALDMTSARLSVGDIRIHEDFDLLTKANDVALVRLGNPVRFQREISPICLAGPASSFRGQVATILSWGQDDVFLTGGAGDGDTDTDTGDEEGGDEEGEDEDDEDEDEDEEGDDDDEEKKKQKRKKNKKRKQRQDLVVEVPVNCRPRKVGLPVLDKVQCARAVDGLLFTPDKGCVGILNVRSIICATDAGGPVQFRGHSGIYELIGVLGGSNDCGVASKITTGPALYSRISQYLGWISRNTRDAYYCSS